MRNGNAGDTGELNPAPRAMHRDRPVDHDFVWRYLPDAAEFRICLTKCRTLLAMADTITFRPDEDTSRALEVLTRDGSPVSAVVRAALIDAARRKAGAAIRAEAETLAADESDRAEAMQVLRDMETLRAW